MRACTFWLAAALMMTPAAARTVIDMTGQAVTVPEQVRRIGCLEVLCYEKLFLLGASDRIAMMIHTNAPWMQATNPAMARIRQLPSNPDIEELLFQRVDVIFRTVGYPDRHKIERLAALGIPVLTSQAIGRIDSAEAFIASRKHMLRLFGHVLGEPYASRAEAWCAYHDRQVAYVRARTRQIPPAQRVRLFHVRGPQATQTQGTDSNTYWYGELAGANMVIKQQGLSGKGEIALEQLLRWDPQVINVGRFYSADLVRKDPRWAHVTAVRQGRVHELPEGVFFWDGSTEGVLLMLYLAKELYPDRFADLDLKQEIRHYYQQFYRYTLSERELEHMLAGRGPDGQRHNAMNN